jgi:hypothetical protein
MADDYYSPSRPAAGVASGRDGVNQPGQYPTSLFGVGLPGGTGAPGTDHAPARVDSTTMAGQYPAREAISGAELGGTGAPGSQGATDNTAGDVTVMYTVTDMYKAEGQSTEGHISDSISGPGDWTAVPGNYPPTHPVSGTQTPTSTGAGQGRIMRGGRQVG